MDLELKLDFLDHILLYYLTGTSSNTCCLSEHLSKQKIKIKTQKKL